MASLLNKNTENSNNKSATVRRWTQTAMECYGRGCRCSGCFYNDFFAGSPQKCQMKHTVLELVRVIGRPKLDNAASAR